MTARTAYLLVVLSLASFLGSGTTTLAQDAQSNRKIAFAKLDARLKLVMDSPTYPVASLNAPGGVELIPVFIRGDVSGAAAAVERAGGSVGSRLKHILTAHIPRSAIERIALDPSIERIESATLATPCDDSLNKDIGANRVHAGATPLEQPYTGKGVIVGIIDTGIDIDHLEFRNRADTSVSRILSVWSQSISTGDNPNGFGYGTEWDKQEIEDQIHDANADEIQKMELAGGSFGTYGVHGTHVTGIAAGRHGVAPDADIIFVQPMITDGGTEAFTTSILDATRYIFEKAQALGRPCVVNLSMSDLQHPHDGSDLFSQAMDELIADGSHRVFCASAGNSGTQSRHWGGFEVESDSLWTYLYSNAELYMRVADADLSRLQFSFVVDTGWLAPKSVGQTAWRTAQSVSDAMVTITETIYKGENQTLIAGRFRLSASSLGNGYTEIMVESAFNDAQSIRVNVRGGGMFHMWSHYMLSREEAQGLGWKTNTRYRTANHLFDMGRPAIAHNVIAVGSAVNLTSYVDPQGTRHTNPSEGSIGKLSTFSSIGPSLDGRVKPDIVAPGEFVVSARSRHLQQQADLTWAPDTTMLVLSGTSMSTPATVGAIALYLQKNPSANFDEVRETIIATARKDAFTASNGALPNGFWGNGKLNIFAALTQPQSGVAVGTTNDSRSDGVSIYSNPATGMPVLHMTLQEVAGVDLALFDLTGKDVLHTDLGRFEPGDYSLPLDVQHLHQGVYAYRLITGKTVHTGMLHVTQ